MADRLDVYSCADCGLMIEVLQGAECEIGCCGKPMLRLAENTVDASKEKHVPVVEPVPGGVKVKVGSVPHPMEEKHYIAWIELIADGRTYRQFLKPGQAPEAVFNVQATEITVREFCNLHGLWKA